MKSFRKGPQSKEQILQWLIELRANPHTPESGYNVSNIFRAAVHGVSDYYFAGVNAENKDHRLTTHGEEGSIAGIVTALGKHGEIVEGWGIGAPKGTQQGTPAADNTGSNCGKCRQQIAGLADPDVVIYNVSLNGRFDSTTVGEFLPHLFSYRQFIPEIAAMKEASRTSGSAPSAQEAEHRLVRSGLLSNREIKQWLGSLESLDWSTQVSQSAVVRLDNGAYVAGTRVEDAAFVSINAAQSVVGIAVSEFGTRNVEEVWVRTKGRDGAGPGAGEYGTLPMSGLQTLLEVAAHRKIRVHFFNESDKVLTRSLVNAAAIAPTSRKPYYTPR